MSGKMTASNSEQSEQQNGERNDVPQGASAELNMVNQAIEAYANDIQFWVLPRAVEEQEYNDALDDDEDDGEPMNLPPQNPFSIPYQGQPLTPHAVEPQGEPPVEPPVEPLPEPIIEPEQEEQPGIYHQFNLLMRQFVDIDVVFEGDDVPFNPWIPITRDPDMQGWEMRIAPIMNNGVVDVAQSEIQIRRIDDHHAPAMTYNKHADTPFEHRYQQYRIDSHTMRLVHRIVATELIWNPDNNPVVDHIDGNKHNNHPSNLRWCTYKQNAAWAAQRRRQQNH
jgi:hypothetical protein